MMDALDQRRVGRVIRETCNRATERAIEDVHGRPRINSPNFVQSKNDRETFEAFEAELRAAGFVIVRKP